MSLEITVENWTEADDLAGATIWSREFGAEASRRAVWGSDAMRALGLEHLPRLADVGSIEAMDEDLAALEREARMVLDHVGAVAAVTGWDAGYIRRRVDYLLEACALARSCGPWGLVYIG
jgi:hypothetical protein